MGGHSGIVQLMNDLGRAMAGHDRVLMLGGGNPARVPGVERVWRRRMQEILAAGDTYERMLANYDTPRGDARFIETFAEFLNRNFSFGVRPENIAVTNGGQVAFFCLVNLLAGPMPDGKRRHVLLPLTPEYIGYADQGLTDGVFRANRPVIERHGAHEFKYRIDFDRLKVTDHTAALCVSRPTNPTGNVVTDEELRRLHALAQSRGIPLIIDNAYGQPFPGIMFGEARHVWPEGSILTYSLSKLGLPGTRTGIIVGPPEIVEAVVSMNSIMNLANGNLGQVLTKPLFADDSIIRLCAEVVRPFYQDKARQAQQWLRESLDDAIDYHVHCCEGALFLWLWFPGLPVRDVELYERLKRRGVLVVPGSYFFYGLDERWPHCHECIRVNYTQPEATVRAGLRILGDEVQSLYRR
jgi:valine--pyruvate aminotransferase